MSDYESYVTQWLETFEVALARLDIDAAAALFQPDGFWRDILAFTWNIETASGRIEVAERLRRRLSQTRPSGFQVATERTPPRLVLRAGALTLEAIIAFDTIRGPCSGVLRLLPDPNSAAGKRPGDSEANKDLRSWGDPKAWLLATSLEEIAGHEEASGPRRPGGESFSREFGGDNWLDLRNKERAFADREPAVLVVGAGQAGLAIAARLHAVGVDTLVIEKHAAVGDSWRKRYHALTLHNEVDVNHFPYLPFPPTFPVYIPKDMLANWFEIYAEAMELNVWTNTELAGGSYDEEAGEWAVTVRATHAPKGKRMERILRPRHVVFAVGVSTIPKWPDLPGLDDFAGTSIHSDSYTDGHEWTGRKALVLGTGNSGHDIAQDLASSGVDTTLIQRAATYIISIKEASRAYGLYFEGIPTADADTLATATSYPVLLKSSQLLTAISNQVDKPLLDGLRAKGFRLTDGPDGGGHRMMYPARGGGYCFNVGASDMIADGRISLLQFDDIDRFVTEGVRKTDGTLVPAELLVLATGYYNQQEVVRAHLGDTVAERVGPVWGFDEGGELRNMWRRTAQPGLWFTAGSLAQSRIFSKVLARQIKACELGLISASLDSADADPVDGARVLPQAGD